MSLGTKLTTSETIRDPARDMGLTFRHLLPRLSTFRRLTPFRPSKIYFTQPYWSAGDHSAALGQTPHEEVRRDLVGLFRERAGIDHRAFVGAVGSGRGALELALRTFARDSRRKSVVIPSYACEGLIQPIRSSGLSARFAEVDATLTTPPENIERVFDSDVLAVVLVNLCGKKLDLAQFKWVRDRGARVIVDNCHALHLQCADPRADAEIYSLGLGKQLSATAGGMLVAHAKQNEITDSYEACAEEDSEQARRRFRFLWSSYMRHDEPSETERTEYQSARTQYGPVKMSPVDCGLILPQLGRCAEIVRDNVDLGSHYERIVKAFPSAFGGQGPDRNAYCKFTLIMSSTEAFNAFWTHMSERGIELEWMYKPLHVKAGNSVRNSALEFSESLDNRVFNVPNRANLTTAERLRIQSALAEFGRQWQ